MSISLQEPPLAENKRKKYGTFDNPINERAPLLEPERTSIAQSIRKLGFKLSNCFEPQLSKEDEEQFKALKEIMKEIENKGLKFSKGFNNLLDRLAKELVLKTNVDFTQLHDGNKGALKRIIGQGIQTSGLEACKYLFIGVLTGTLLATAFPKGIESAMNPEFGQGEKVAIILATIAAFFLSLYVAKKIMDKIEDKIVANDVIYKINNESNHLSFPQRVGHKQVVNSASNARS